MSTKHHMYKRIQRRSILSRIKVRKFREEEIYYTHKCKYYANNN